MQITGAHAAVAPSATQMEPVAHVSVVCAVPSALHESTAVLSVLQTCVLASQTMGSMGTQTK